MTDAPEPFVEAAADEPSGLGVREVVVIVGALLGSAVITLAVLSGRGSVAATGSVPPPAPVPGPASPAPSGAATVVSAKPSDHDAPAGWTVSSAAWTGDDRQSIALELPARNETPVWMRSVRPLLVVRCMAKRADVFVFTDSPAAMEATDDDHTVRVAIDGKPERTERWPDSRAHDALFAPDGAAFLAELQLARTLRFGYTPHNAAPAVADFDVAGLAEKLAPAAARCNAGR